MLIACPECEHKVSDRAAACPSCAFPIAEHLAEQKAAQEAIEERTARKAVDAMTDCPPCKGRGFVMEKTGEVSESGHEHETFWWCDECNKTGRLPVAQSTAGYFAIATDHLDAFIGGELDRASSHVFEMGPEPPPPPNYGPDGTLVKALDS